MGKCVGMSVGDAEGNVGIGVGDTVGKVVGMSVGDAEGIVVGKVDRMALVGSSVGDAEGKLVGITVGV